jgi:methylenetetrahydrofolate dehydrogenase (NADP+)/methenyltetrahydrofolate cyclohydrolase
MIVNGNEIKQKIVEEIREMIEKASSDESTARRKRVCFVQIGNDAGSTAFVKMKVQLAETLGIAADVVQKDITTTEETIVLLAEVIEKNYDGIVVQLPLPQGMDTELVIDSIPTEQDIDMLSEDAKVQYRNATTERTAPVAAAVQAILWQNKIILVDKKIVVMGRGRLVGEPVTMLLDRQELAYTVIDIDTPADVRATVLKEADVIISGMGTPHAITPDMIKQGAVLIDAGTSESNGKLAGDIDPACADKASVYTPVPGGVGPITVACLFRNLFL